MKRTFSHILGLLGVFAAGAALANPIHVTYDIADDYRYGGFRASVVHGATGCGSTGPDTGDTLYMCGSPNYSTFGTIEGWLDDGVLDITGGTLNIGGSDYDVLGGQLGAFGEGNIWSVSIEHFGEFLFENIDMGTGRPNFYDGETLILWGQNQDAYDDCTPDSSGTTCNRWGIDLYGEAQMQVPEPGTLALFGGGLIFLKVMYRRRRVVRA